MPDGVGGHLQFFLSLNFWELMLESHLHKLILLNAGCCVLYLVGKILQEMLLGPLREMEAMKVRACARALARPRQWSPGPRGRACAPCPARSLLILAQVGDRIRSYALVKVVFIAAILHDHDDKEMMVRARAGVGAVW